MEVIKKVKLDGKYFAEGIALCRNFIFQLTWTNREILKYSYPDLELIEKLPLDKKVGEGWGLTTDGKFLYATDGSNKIYTMNCDDLKVIKTQSVYFNKQAVTHLNSIAIVDGIIYANKYLTNEIYKIDVESGTVLKVYDMKHLAQYELKQGTLTSSYQLTGYVLNGIAYNPEKKNFLLAGKLWGFYYEVDLK